MQLDRNITLTQKLQAIQFKYHDYQKWEPKVGDFYTIVRNDLKLFKIVREEAGQFFFICNEYDGESAFPVEGFADKDFGINRVHVPEWIFNTTFTPTLEERVVKKAIYFAQEIASGVKWNPESALKRESNSRREAALEFLADPEVSKFVPPKPQEVKDAQETDL